MKATIICTLALLFSFISLVGQSDSVSHYTFSYDDSGNRVSRDVIYYQSKGAKVSLTKPKKEDEIESVKGFNIWPNPADHCVFVSLSDEAMKEVTRKIYLYDNSGRMILSMDAQSEVNQVDMQTLPSASYILRLVYGSRHKEWIIIKN